MFEADLLGGQGPPAEVLNGHQNEWVVDKWSSGRIYRRFTEQGHTCDGNFNMEWNLDGYYYYYTSSSHFILIFQLQPINYRLFKHLHSLSALATMQINGCPYHDRAFNTTVSFRTPKPAVKVYKEKAIFQSSHKDFNFCDCIRIKRGDLIA